MSSVTLELTPLKVIKNVTLWDTLLLSPHMTCLHENSDVTRTLENVNGSLLSHTVFFFFLLSTTESVLLPFNDVITDWENVIGASLFNVLTFE